MDVTRIPQIKLEDIGCYDKLSKINIITSLFKLFIFLLIWLQIFHSNQGQITTRTTYNFPSRSLF